MKDKFLYFTQPWPGAFIFINKISPIMRNFTDPIINNNMYLSICTDEEICNNMATGWTIKIINDDGNSSLHGIIIFKDYENYYSIEEIKFIAEYKLIEFYDKNVYDFNHKIIKNEQIDKLMNILDINNDKLRSSEAIEIINALYSYKELKIDYFQLVYEYKELLNNYNNLYNKNYNLSNRYIGAVNE